VSSIEPNVGEAHHGPARAVRRDGGSGSVRHRDVLRWAARGEGAMELPDGTIERATEILRTVAHPLRLRILSLLCRGDESVAGMSARLRASPAAVSQALQILRREGLVAVTRHRRATYRLDLVSLRELVPVIERTLRAATVVVEPRTSAERRRASRRSAA
jgi:ArsR family transcriptional regulator